MSRFVVSLLALAVSQGSPTGGPVPAIPASPELEIVHVDGTRSPELIPQWSVWGYVFRIVSGGPRQLPTSVLKLVSKEEEALVISEADAVQKIDAACQSRVARAATQLGTDPIAAVDAKVREISLDCRRETLRARDRLLAALNPEGAAALAAFAESTKAGTSISLPKKDLARYLEPE
jgi:hypothetical protein